MPLLALREAHSVPFHRARAGVLPARRQLEPAVPQEANMARNTEVTLDPLVIDVANVDIRAHASVTFNASDKDANTPYRMVATLVGHDFEGESPRTPPTRTSRTTRTTSVRVTLTPI